MTTLPLALRRAKEIRDPACLSSAVRRTAKTISLISCLGAVLLSAFSLPAQSANLYQEITNDDRLALFANAVEKAGLAQKLMEAGPLMLFAPSDQAMHDQGSAFLLEQVLLTPSNAGRLADLVEHHIVPAKKLSLESLDRIKLPTLANVPLRVDPHGTTLIIDGRAIVTAHVVADNGTLFIVDRLLWPRDWRAGADMSSDVAARIGCEEELC